MIALDSGGQTPDSEELAGLLARWTETGKKLAFLIGGAEGFDAAVIARANARLSLGRLTWPHLLVRPMLAEQIYRAQIDSGRPSLSSRRPALKEPLFKKSGAKAFYLCWVSDQAHDPA